MSHDLAQLNVARLRAPIDDPSTAEFVAALEPINLLAEASPGFVWRYQTEDGNATAERPLPDDQIIVNCSTWESIAQLSDFVYRSLHTDYLRQRRQWFERSAESTSVLWWVPPGHRPSITEALNRLDRLRSLGPTRHAFTFHQPYPPEVKPGAAP